MIFYKELAKILVEIIFSLGIITFGYNIWDNFDRTGLEIARYYSENFEIIDYELNN